MNTLESAVRRLTQPINGQFPRPWMTDMAHPENARIFTLGCYPANPCPDTLPGGHEAFIDALFNRNGKSTRWLYGQITGGESSRTRPNIAAFSQVLAKVGITDVLETNVICYSTPRCGDLSKAMHRDGKAAGQALFGAILSIIRPAVLVVHGAGALKELARVLGTALPSPPKFQSDGVISTRVHLPQLGDAYAPTVFVIPPLALPAWNTWPERLEPKWHTWAEEYLADVSSQVRKLLDVSLGQRVP